MQRLRDLAAGCVYALLTFFIGFALGTVRVLLVAPRLGPAAAVTLEAPVMLIASWYLCRWCITRFDVPEGWDSRVRLGALAFGVLLLAEISLSVFVFRRSLAEYLAGYQSLSGGIGLAAQLVFASFPFLQGWRTPRAQ